MLRRRADKGDPVRIEDVGEFRVLRQEAVTRMHRIRTRDLAGRDDRRYVQIAFARRRRADAHALIREPHMHRIGVRRRVNGDRLDAHLAAGTMDAQRDFATVCNEDLLEHEAARYSMTKSGSPNSTGWPSSTRTAVSLPERGAGMWFIVFMASMMRIVCPSLTLVPGCTKVGAPGSGER